MNLYTFFNVPERGAILNNSYNLSNTELAGYVQGNPSLMGGAARIIVNEVTSANPSELRGFLEVAGDRAGVVIANPNGILADGAGFLNTARVTLATGRTAMDAAGNLATLRIDDGKVVITGKGLSAKGVDSAELYARAIEINAGLWAEHARLVTGANTIRYESGDISPPPLMPRTRPPMHSIFRQSAVCMQIGLHWLERKKGSVSISKVRSRARRRPPSM